MAPSRHSLALTVCCGICVIVNGLDSSESGRTVESRQKSKLSTIQGTLYMWSPRVCDKCQASHIHSLFCLCLCLYLCLCLCVSVSLSVCLPLSLSLSLSVISSLDMYIRIFLRWTVFIAVQYLFRFQNHIQILKWQPILFAKSCIYEYRTGVNH